MQNSGRRKVRRRKSSGEKSGAGFIVVVVIMLAAVVLGYITARFVIGPLIGYNSGESLVKILDDGKGDEGKGDEGKGDDAAKENDSAGGEQSGEQGAAAEAGQTGAVGEGGGEGEGDGAADASKTDSSTKEELTKGYAIQFGAYTNKEAADELARQLQSNGIETKVIEVDGVFKVISPLMKDKAEALQKLESLKNVAIEDVFIAYY